MKIISRKEARNRGFYKYYTGQLCNYGHISERYISNYGCIQCHKVIRNRYRNREVATIQMRRWRRNNPEKVKILNKKVWVLEKKKRKSIDYLNKSREKKRIFRIRDIRELTDSYIKERICEIIGCLNKDIPFSLVGLYREVLINKRLIKERGW